MKILLVLFFVITIKSERLLVSQDNGFVDDDNDFAGGIFPITDSNSDVLLVILIKTYNKAL